MALLIPKIAVFMDTSALRGSGWATAPFQSLLELCKAGLVDVFIPELVLEERRTQWRDRHMGALRDCAASLRALTADDIYPASHLGAAKTCLEALTKVDLDAASKAAFSELFKQNQVKIIPLSMSQAKTAWSLYFEGTAPLKKTKNREDIPDAHIYAAAQEILFENREVHCVCCDGALSAALSDLVGMTVYSSVEELMKTDAVARARTHWESEKVWHKVEPSLSYLDLKAEVVDFIEREAGNFLTGTSIDSSMIPTGAARIDWADGGELVEVENPDDWGGGVLGFEVAFECDAGISLLIFRDDAPKLPHWLKATWGDPLKHSMIDVEGTLRLYVEGSVTAQVDFVRAEAREPPLLSKLSLRIASTVVHGTL